MFDYYGKRTNYGVPVGILMLNTCFPRMPGDIGNATTFSFPVCYKVIEQADYSSVVSKPDFGLVAPFVEAARELERAGCRAVFTSCGFLAIFQREISQELDIPFISSSLMQVKYVHAFLPRGKKVGIVTAYANKLTRRHFEGVGIADIPKKVVGLDGMYFGDFLKDMPHEFDSRQAESDMLEVVGRMLSEDGDIGALVFECTNMPPFAYSVQNRYHLPVYDAVTMINYIESGIVRNRFEGFM